MNCQCGICESLRRGISEESYSFKETSKAFALAKEKPGMPIYWYEAEANEPLQKDDKKKEKTKIIYDERVSKEYVKKNPVVLSMIESEVDRQRAETNRKIAFQEDFQI